MSSFNKGIVSGVSKTKMNEGKTNIEQLIFAISKIIDSILEIERRIICRIQYLF